MATHNKFILFIGMTIFLLALLLGLAFNAAASYTDLEGMSFWGSPEGTSFDSTLDTDGELGSLRCPVIMAADETKTVSITVHNPKNFAIQPSLQATLSDPTVWDNALRDKQAISLQPGEKKTFSWQVNGEKNLVFNRVILVRVFLFQSPYHPPSLTRHCGILVTEVGDLSGNQLVSLVTIISLGGMLLGILLWYNNIPRRTRRDNRGLSIMASLMGLTAVTILTNLLGWMVGAGMLLILTLLLFLAIMETLFIRYA